MHPALLVGAGFLLGTAGVKAIKSEPARKLCVKGIACGMKVRDDITTMVDEARMQIDDLVAEASYENAKQMCGCYGGTIVEEEILIEDMTSDDGIAEGAGDGADAKPTAKSAKAPGRTSRKSPAKA